MASRSSNLFIQPFLKQFATGISPTRWYLVFAIPLFIWLSWASVNFQFATFGYWQDIWEHAATIKEWMTDLWNPGNPHLSTNDGSARYAPYFFVLTLLGKLFQLTALEALGIGGILNAAILLFGIYLFTKAYFNSDWAPVISLIVFLGGWGMGWIWASNYQLRSLFYVISYPATFSFALSLVAFWLVLKLLRESHPNWISFIAFALSISTLLVVHPPTGSFALASSASLIIFEPHVKWLQRAKVICVLFVGSVAVELWPYFSTWGLILHSSHSAWDMNPIINGSSSWTKLTFNDDLLNLLRTDHPLLPVEKSFYSPIFIAGTIGPALLGLPILLYSFIRGQHKWFVLAGFIMMLAGYLSEPLFNAPLGHRFLYFMVFYLHLAIIGFLVHGLGLPIKDRATHPSCLTVSCLAVMVVSFIGNIGLAVIMFAGYHPQLSNNPPYRLEKLQRYSKLQPVMLDSSRIGQLLSDDAVVIGLPWEIWPIPTFSGKVTAINHPNPFVLDGAARYAESTLFFYPNVAKETRQMILTKYGVTHILLNTEFVHDEKTRQQIELFGEVVGRIKRFEIIKLPSKGLKE